MSCPPGYAPYQGNCLSPAEQDHLGPVLCREDEYWVTEPQRGCKCLPGMVRAKGGVCEPTASFTKAASWGLGIAGVLALAYWWGRHNG